MVTYDSRPDTEGHIQAVQAFLREIVVELEERAIHHDETKLAEPEKSAFDEWTPRLRNTTYGSPEYQECLAGLAEALQHHYAHNSHHPEYHAKGVAGMTLVDLVEMFCDWKAATLRHLDGSLGHSIQVNRKRFGLSDQLVAIFENTRDELGW